MDDVVKEINIKKLSDEMSLEEKISLFTGEGKWHIKGPDDLPSVKFGNGPSGLRMLPDDGQSTTAFSATCFPSPSCIACSWDRNLAYDVGKAIGEEATALGVNVVLAPGVNIKRNPLCGRNFEYYSEDPFLAGEIGAAYINGVQSVGTGACLKHFAASSQETSKYISDSVIDERALREIYLAPFERALKANPVMVMCAPNKLNGVYCCENSFLINDILRGEFEFKGVTVSDWCAVHDRAKAFECGLDLSVPDDRGLFDGQILNAVKIGAISEDEVTQAACRIIDLIDNVYLDPYGDMEIDKHEAVAYRAALGGIVLLKNDGILPLTADVKLVVMGEAADSPKIQGEGSGEVNAVKTVSAVESFTKRDRAVEFYLGYNNGDEVENVTLRREAIENTANDEVIVVFLALDSEEEGFDRKDMHLPKNQEALVDALVRAGRRVVLVLNTGCPVELPWAHKANAIIQAGLSGGMGALATVDVLIGRQNPQGRLAESYPIKYRDCISSDYFASGEIADYRESLYVGYRYYDKAKMRVRFPFGHGLNYSNIEYKKLNVIRRGEYDYIASITLENKSARGAYEVVQVYVSDLTDTVHRPEKELKGFEKVYVDSDAEVTVNIPLDFRSFAFYDTESKKWSAGRGTYVIRAGGSSSALPLSFEVALVGDGQKDSVPAIYRTLEGSFSRKDLETLIGRAIEEREVEKPIGLSSPLKDVRGKFFGNRLIAAVKKRASRREFECLLDIPLDGIAEFMNYSPSRIHGIIDLINGHIMSGLKKYFKK